MFFQLDQSGPITSVSLPAYRLNGRSHLMIPKSPSIARQIKGLFVFEELAQQLNSRYGTRTCFIGHSIVDGQYTRQVALVCAVKRKRRNMSLHDPERIRRHVHFKDGERCCKIKTDVVSINRAFRYENTINPGDRVSGAGNSSATVGAFANHTTLGEVFITAGHFGQSVGGKGQSVRLSDLQNNNRVIVGTIEKAITKQALDYSLITVGNHPASAVTNRPIRGIYQPSITSDLGKPLYLVTRGNTFKTVSRGINAQVDLGDGKKALKNVILTDAISQPGDSGGALVDRDFRVWGFLLGSIPGKYSVFMPVTKLMTHERLQFGGQ